jgi:hypothetical protein
VSSSATNTTEQSIPVHQSSPPTDDIPRNTTVSIPSTSELPNDLDIVESFSSSETLLNGIPTDQLVNSTSQEVRSTLNTTDSRRHLQRRATSSSHMDGPVKYRGYRVSVTAALTGEYAEQSKQAIIDEIKNLIEFQVGTYYNWSKLKPYQRNNVLRSFMFLKHKFKPDGRYERTKARIVGDGDKQKAHMFDMIYSATVDIASVFLLLNIASYHRCRLCSYDIKGAFLNAEFTTSDPEIFLVIPASIATIWLTVDPSAAPFLNDKGELLLKLDRFIYGLKQSPYKFQQHLRNTLISIGYSPLLNDECIYVKAVGSHFSILSTHVDDILQVSTLDHLVDELHHGLIAEYKSITFNAEADSYLGMRIQRSADKSTFKVTQSGLAQQLIDKHVTPDSKTSSSP